MIRTYSDRTLGAFYYYSCASGKLTKLSDVSPWLKKEEMAAVKPITYTSRDGMTIHGYLTLPVGRKGEKLPVVVLPHGGPWARDYWRFFMYTLYYFNVCSHFCITYFVELATGFTFQAACFLTLEVSIGPVS